MSEPRIITYYAAAPIAKNDADLILVDHSATVICADADAAIECARIMSLSPGHVGAVAIARTDGDTVFLKRFGGV